jgi:hypothetical protein
VPEVVDAGGDEECGEEVAGGGFELRQCHA